MVTVYRWRDGHHQLIVYGDRESLSLGEGLIRSSVPTDSNRIRGDSKTCFKQNKKTINTTVSGESDL